VVPIQLEGKANVPILAFAAGPRSCNINQDKGQGAQNDMKGNHDRAL
jgi:hypothetical protein